MKKKKICIFTGTRAEYGLLKPLIDELKLEESIELQLIISGMHLSPEFGLTFKEIDLECFSKVEKVEILLSSDSPVGVSKAMGLGMISYSEVLEKLKPDLLVGLGDRFELFSIVTAALIQKISVAHIHGGEVTSGAYDDAFRHSITKMSHIHFTSTEIYRKRVIQLGENPKTVFNVGALGIDNIKKMKLQTLHELEKSISFNLDKPFFLVTFHPVTLGNVSSQLQFKELLKALDYFKDFKIIFTMPNADNDGKVISKMIEEYEKNDNRRCISFKSMGQLRYLSVLRHCKLMIGNSSSGIIEMPFFNKPTINIGDRQKGRLFAKSIIQCDGNLNSIVEAIRKGLDEKFRKSFNKNNCIHGTGNTAVKIKSIINKIHEIEKVKKIFFDL
jgi:GDP/UDP-N,N'-diacetylbacillosamine 2-epimerase (hydrolysing)